MRVDLMWVTPNAEQVIIDHARVSSGKRGEPGVKLIKYLLEHGHVSPFEQANMCVEIQTSRAISAQILRHRSFSFQEFSQRYSKTETVEPVELRRHAEKNRQSSTEVVEGLDFLVDDVVDFCLSAYNRLLASGVAKECARMILPMASTTTLFMNGSLRSWIHYLKLRTKPETQKEHREIAEAIEAIFAEEFPIIHEAAFFSEVVQVRGER